MKNSSDKQEQGCTVLIKQKNEREIRKTKERKHNNEVCEREKALRGK